MRVLGVVHGDEVRSGVFGEVVAERGDTIEEWSVPSGRPPPRPLSAYDAAIVFGGSMHPDQEELHPWLSGERELLRRLLGEGTPLLGVCLGAELVAQAVGAKVGPSREPEVGWFDVELAPEGESDPVLGALPPHFVAFQWHFYAYEVPSGAVELASSPACSQAFRLGERTWGVQFHPEVTLEQVESWIVQDPQEIEGDLEALRRETRARIEEWNDLGRRLCAAFLDAAESARLAA
jgi:GMP synthase (glutamine-hydrolysing)